MVTNFLDVQCALPIELIPDHTFRRASDSEINRIQQLLRFYPTNPFGGSYEDEWILVDPAKPDGARESQPIDRCRWRYYVIEPPQDGVLQQDGSRPIDGHQIYLEMAARLCGVELRTPVTIHPNGNSIMIEHGNTLFPPVQLHEGVKTLEVFDSATAAEIREAYNSLVSLPSEYADIKRTVALFYALRPVYHEELYVLGLFAIIESLLTHDSTGAYDSLTHQIVAKVPLLEARMKSRLDYSVFRDADVSTIWKRLYKYRSAIAHGGIADFESSLQILRSAFVARTFLTHAAKALIRHAMNEPQLVLDLKKV